MVNFIQKLESCEFCTLFFWVFLNNHKTSKNSQANIGNLLKKQSDFYQARQHYESALSCNSATYGDYHPVTASDCINLGNILVCLKKEADAYEYYQRASDARNSFFGPEHPLTKEAEKLSEDTSLAYQDAMESGPSIVHRKCF